MSAVDDSGEADQLLEEIRDLKELSVRYRTAAEQSLEQLDHCIDQLLSDKATASMGRQVRKNQRSIRRRMTGDET